MLSHLKSKESQFPAWVLGRILPIWFLQSQRESKPQMCRCLVYTVENLWLDLSGFGALENYVTWYSWSQTLWAIVRSTYHKNPQKKKEKGKQGASLYRTSIRKITGLKMKNFFKKKKTYLSISPHHQLLALITTIKMQLVLFESAPSDWSSC